MVTIVYSLMLALAVSINLQSPTSEIDSLENRLIFASGEEKLQLLNHLSQLYSQRDPRKAIDYGQRALDLSSRLQDKQNEAIALRNIGQGYEFLSAYDKALDQYMRSLALFQDLRDSVQIAHTQSLIGFIYWYLENLDMALDYYERSLQLAKSIHDPFRIVTNLNRIGLVYWARQEHETALRYFHEGLKIARRMNYADRMAAIYNNMGLVFLDQKRYPQALEVYSKALEINQRLQRPLSIVENLNNLGNVYIKLGDFSRAEDYLTRARKIAIQRNSKYLLQDNNYYFYKLYHGRGNHKRALEYYVNYAELNDSLVSAKTRLRIEELQTRHLMDKKENEIKLLKTEKQLKESQIKAQRNWLIFLSILLVVVVGAMGLIVHQYVSKTKAYKVLVKKNLKIVEYEKQLIELLKKSEFSTRKELLEQAENMGISTTKEEPDSKENEPEKARAKSNKEKYSLSPLTEGQKQKIMNDILFLMNEKKFYLNNDATIDKLSRMLNVNRSYVSQIINEKFHKSFTNFINDYRIKEARRLLSEDKDRIYTIESVARSVGFNSNNAFNRAFKRFTGITPSFFIQSLRNKGK